jgi:endoplasmic reticulum chaperone BiP
VTAEDKGTGNKNNIVINSNTNRLSPDEIDRMIKDSEKFADDDKKVKDRVDAKNELESYVIESIEQSTVDSCSMCFRLNRYAYSLKTQLNDKEKLGGKLSDDDKKTVENAVETQIKWLEANADADTSQLKEHKKQLEDIVTPIMTKLYGQGGPGAGDVPHPPPPSSHGHDDDSL